MPGDLKRIKAFLNEEKLAYVEDVRDEELKGLDIWIPTKEYNYGDREGLTISVYYLDYKKQEVSGFEGDVLRTAIYNIYDVDEEKIDEIISLCNRVNYELQMVKCIFYRTGGEEELSSHIAMCIDMVSFVL